MKTVIQRVSRAEVCVEEASIARINQGILALVAIQKQDTARECKRLADKLMNYRIFEDADGKMNLSVVDISGGILLVPQFTLAADTRKGLRPGFSHAADPAFSAAMFDDFRTMVEQTHTPVECGRFGADMQVSLVNDGPVTFVLEVQNTDS